jgi:osmotically-inducible protein OsmY
VADDRKTKLIAHGAIDSERINVTTENGVVYLMGYVRKSRPVSR